jgi:hypothetical protein
MNLQTLNRYVPLLIMFLCALSELRYQYLRDLEARTDYLKSRTDVLRVLPLPLHHSTSKFGRCKPTTFNELSRLIFLGLTNVFY